MSTYRWSVSQQVVEQLLNIRGSRKRQKLIDFFDRLAADPEGLSEEPFSDDEGNTYQLVAFGRALMGKNHASNGNSNDRDNRNNDRLFSLFGHFVFLTCKLVC